MDELRLDRNGSVATLTINRPERKNAMTGEMFTGIARLLREVGDDTSIRTLVITGAGGDFCAGADVGGDSAARAERPKHQLRTMHDLNQGALLLHELPIPTIAKVDGVAVGAGMNLALGCDLVVASDRARFAEIFANVGLAIDYGGSWILPRLIGLHKAKELVFTADILSAGDAAELGLVNHVVPSDELDAKVDELAAKLAAAPTVAIAMSKKLLNASMSSSMSEALNAEAMAQSVAITGTADATEGFTAFAEKRKPDFEGR